MNTFICYEKCSTCRKAEKWLNDHQIEYQKRLIDKEKPAAEEIEKWARISGRPLNKFFNTSGRLYREQGLSKHLLFMSDEEILETLASDGMMVKRPIFLTDDTVLVGFKEEEWSEKLQ